MNNGIVDIPEDLSDFESVSMIKSPGIVNNGYKLISKRPDRSGLLLLVEEQTRKTVRVHPTRVSKITDSGSMCVKEKDGTMTTACPECGTIIIFKEDETPVCPVHGEVNIVETMQGKASKAPTRSKSQEIDNKADLDELASCGELWVKSGVKFDDKTDVKTLCLIIGNRYTTFNIYDGTYGRKGNKPPIEGMQKDEVGYKVKDIEKIRKDKIKKGYELWSTEK